MSWGIPVGFVAEVVTAAQRHGWGASTFFSVDFLIELAIWLPLAGLGGMRVGRVDVALHAQRGDLSLSRRRVTPRLADPMAVPPNRYAAFSFPDLRLKYQPYEVSGVLVLRRADGASRDVPFTGVLVPRPRVEKRRSPGDALSSV